ncbi:MAG: dihydroxyacetone kinase subunit L [Clostridiales Family XIII bacterium]|jgi:dihydroxyacetone kinase-like protein|nr:dihydroxyacetone kinase subunit L [Clostridiales Family XIII bacterium]
MAKDITLVDFLRAISNAMIAAEHELTELDSALGDGDCGQGMKTGFTAVLEALQDGDGLSPNDVLKKTAMALISAVGGTSGAIYGTAFMKMAAAAKEPPADLVGVADILEAGLNGAKMRGEDTKIGDKTLVDALEPAVYAFKEKAVAGASLQEALDAALDAAQKGSDSTIDLIAKKGRASYLGERSIGHRDAGSYGIVVIAQAARDTANA